MENQNIKIVTTSRGPVEYLDTGNGEVVLCWRKETESSCFQDY